MTLTRFVFFSKNIADRFADSLVEIAKRCVKASLIIDTIRSGENLKAGNSEQVLPCVVGIADQMLFDECLDFTPVRKLARELTRSGQQNELLAERTAQKQDVGMSIWHGLIIAREAI